jgi:hypothetical protein
MSRFRPNAWYEEQQPDAASADEADTAGIAAAQERFRRWFGLPAEDDDDEAAFDRARTHANEEN